MGYLDMAPFTFHTPIPGLFMSPAWHCRRPPQEMRIEYGVVLNLNVVLLVFKSVDYVS